MVRPIRAYHELLIQAILAPGSEQIVEDLFNSYGEECIRYNLQVKAEWAEIIKAPVDTDVGTPIPYEDSKGKVISNAHPHNKVEAKAIFVIACEDNIQSDTAIQTQLETALLKKRKGWATFSGAVFTTQLFLPCRQPLQCHRCLQS